MPVSPNMRGHVHVCIFNLESGMAIYTKSVYGQNAEGLSWYEKRSEKGPMANCLWKLVLLDLSVAKAGVLRGCNMYRHVFRRE